MRSAFGGDFGDLDKVNELRESIDYSILLGTNHELGIPIARHTMIIPDSLIFNGPP
jgi:hypothetical protein